MSKEPPEEKEFTPEELAKAERVTWIIYGLMAVMIIVPFVVAIILKSKQ